MADPSSEVPLPPSVEEILRRICEEQSLPPPDSRARTELISLGEKASLHLLRKISVHKIQSLNGFIIDMTKKSDPVATQESVSFSMPQQSSSGSCSISPQDDAISHCPSSEQSTTQTSSSSLSLERSSRPITPHLKALGELEFRKAFLILSYIGKKRLEDVISVNVIQKLKNLPMDEFEPEVWSVLGRQCIEEIDRQKVLNWDSGKTYVYHCYVYPDGSYRFKGPYLDNTRTHLQRVLGDDNVLIVKFTEEVTDRSSSALSFNSSNAEYLKIAKEGILVGLRRYRFFGKWKKIVYEKNMAFCIHSLKQRHMVEDYKAVAKKLQAKGRQNQFDMAKNSVIVEKIAGILESISLVENNGLDVFMKSGESDPMVTTTMDEDDEAPYKDIDELVSAVVFDYGVFSEDADDDRNNEDPQFDDSASTSSIIDNDFENPIANIYMQVAEIDTSSSRPPDSRVSYAQALVKSFGTHPSSLEDISLKGLFMLDQSQMVKKPSTFQGEPALFFSSEEIENSSAPFRFSIIAKFAFAIRDARHALIRFESESDYLALWLKEVGYISRKLVRFIKGSPYFKSGFESSIVANQSRRNQNGTWIAKIEGSTEENLKQSNDYIASVSQSHGKKNSGYLEERVNLKDATVEKEEAFTNEKIDAEDPIVSVVVLEPKEVVSLTVSSSKKGLLENISEVEDSLGRREVALIENAEDVNVIFHSEKSAVEKLSTKISVGALAQKEIVSFSVNPSEEGLGLESTNSAGSLRREAVLFENSANGTLKYPPVILEVEDSA
ncbi:hypothetical protein HHK36_021680 [Tetracentron sinense]|uniref:RNA-dependent RNA polymerase n=1 Tax=Tetracentron sinense TaxID=13715 RepID=A0A835D824_TETSI|nr:hypothetical protein HHK36_021680 [Tetracentron sinense]